MSDSNPVTNDPVQQVVDATQELQELQQRLRDLDTERVSVQQRIAACMLKIAAVTGQQVPPPADASLANRILWILRRHRDRPLSPADVAEMLGLRRHNELENVRLHLSRMYQKAWLKKVGHGRYLVRNDV
jgi:hypothetical protein